MTTVSGDLVGGLLGAEATPGSHQAQAVAIPTTEGYYAPPFNALVAGGALIGGALEGLAAGQPVTLVGKSYPIESDSTASAYVSTFSMRQFQDSALEALANGWGNPPWESPPEFTYKRFRVRFNHQLLYTSDPTYVQASLQHTLDTATKFWEDRYHLSATFGGMGYFSWVDLTPEQSDSLKVGWTPSTPDMFLAMFLLAPAGVSVPVVRLDEVYLEVEIEVAEEVLVASGWKIGL